VRPLWLVVALLVTRVPVCAATWARQGADEVAAALRARRAAPAPRVPGEARRLYVIVAPPLDAARRAALEAAGLAIELPAPGRPTPAWRDGLVVQGLATAAAERTLAALPFVRRLEPPGEAWTSVGSVTSAGVGLHGLDAAAAVLGTDGAGITVGVVSDGADDRDASVATGDVPPDVAVPPGLPAGRGVEGTALLELVHDAAPGARLLFAGVATSAEMLAAIDGLAAAGAQVIVDDLAFSDEPKYEDGPIALAARRFVERGGVYVTAAGNFGARHYEAAWRPGAADFLAGTGYAAAHDFGGGDFGDDLVLAPGAEVLVVLQWNERFGAARTDLDLVLARSPADIVAVSEAVQDGEGTPLEAVRHVNAAASSEHLWLAIAEFGQRTTGLAVNVHVFARGAVQLEHVVARDSVFGHAAVAQVLSVAAVPAAAPDHVEPFSSRGPATLYFPVRTARAVPRLAAVDGVETAIGRRGAFPDPFFGTSAAAPHVAGCAALLLAAGAPPGDVVRALLATATDVGRPGLDYATGAGRLECAAAARLASGRRTPPIVSDVQAAFAPDAALVVAARGDDADGDARRARVRLLAADGHELARSTVDVAPSGTGFVATLRVRRPRLATARLVGVAASDATGLAGPEATVVLGCPGDGTIGDAFCAAGAIAERLRGVRGARGRRLARVAAGVARALAAAGRAGGRGRARVAAHALGAAARRLARLARMAPRIGIAGDVATALVDAADALAARVAQLREPFTDPSSVRNAARLSCAPRCG
jgi:hypothetical protein